MKSNIHKKLTREDKFARKYLCDNARLNEIRFSKKYNHKKYRRLAKVAICDQSNKEKIYSE